MSESNSTAASPSKQPLNLDQVFQRTATKNIQSPANSLKRCLRLTPLSKKACLIHGIDPSALQNRDYASFARTGLDPEIQSMHYEVYLHTREKLMELASAERSKLQQRMNASIESGDSNTIGSAWSSHHGFAEDGLGMEQMEKRRLEKVARRQQKELLRMLVSLMSVSGCNGH
jgi:hypothetical protein